ncbi:putative membrane protein [Metallosphaera yellowstonensis MK1]|jgi:uncharacterized membrane protein (DUF373 family)|uniref:Putative membrane protein n=1 Tax=Metallosphaera yellowstonensis MK1 TaxID=671065 RepID=H2C806_9CREN|nr:phosphate-starvation-inducible PsiE family protein [Metallosphaera yellowstonensis]EHP68282.1 putative membrane protein [Metallosphaera yellowstonensis MK1]
MRLPNSVFVIKIVSIIVQIFLLLGLGFAVLSTILQIISSLQFGFLLVASIVLENVLLIIVFLEVYLSALDFFEGRGRSVVYVIDAMLSFVAREIIIEILAPPVNAIDLLTLSALIASGAFARFILTRRSRSSRRGGRYKRGSAQ